MKHGWRLAYEPDLRAVREGRRHPRGSDYRFPCEEDAMDVVFAASVFTHMLPHTTSHYIRETARVLKRGGTCLFSFSSRLLRARPEATQRVRPFGVQLRPPP